MGDFPAGDGSDLGGFECDDSGAVTIKGNELDFVRLIIAVDVHHGAHDAGLQPFFGNGEGHYHALMLFDHPISGADGQ